MAYIGNEPAEAYSNIAYQDFGTQSGTTFTLDYPAGAPGELEVFVNNVRQEPSVAYTVSGTTLTMTGTVAASDDFYVVFQGKAQQTVTHPANTALAATTGTFSGALSATTGTFSGAVSMGANNITFSNGNGIDFSATAGSGATSSILHDYEEGTFTLQMFDASSGGNASSTTGSGYYTKIGRQVSITVGAVNNVSTSGLTDTNSVYLSLPFTASNPSGRSAGSVIFHGVDYTDSTTQANLTVSAGAARGQLRVSGNGRADGTIKVEDFNGTSDDIVFLTLSYTTDA